MMIGISYKLSSGIEDDNPSRRPTADDINPASPIIRNNYAIIPIVLGP